VALVTGGARGQGRAHALALAELGATVVVCDIARQLPTVRYPMPGPEDLAETVAAIHAIGVPGRGEIVDVRDASAVTSLVDGIVAEYGRLDILVANAAITGFVPFTEISDDIWHDTIETNLTGVFNSMRAAVPHMTTAGYGRIVAISSGAGRAGMQHLAHYSASKWGVIGLVKTVALEVGRYGVTANVVCPTSVATPMMLNEALYRRLRPDLQDPTADDVAAAFAGLSPLGIPWLQPEDVTRAVMYLVTDPGVTTGSVLEVNLGTSASRT
jgi:SDR family mycofactocin-dependent oxidoreductase